MPRSPKWSLLTGSPIKTSNTFLTTLMRATWLTGLVVLDFIKLVIFTKLLVS
jgi:hypothetical protein